MPKQNQPRLKICLLILIILLSLSCSFLGSAAQPAENTPPPTQAAARLPTQEQPRSLKPQPTQGSASTDSLQIDYIYTSNLITILYPLYGSKLDDFTIVTITNTSTTPAELIVTSEVTGYTTPAIDTVTVEANSSLEVRQNPRLIPSVIDQLNVEKPAQFYIKITELDNGVEKMVLEETKDILVYARRDFPWSIPGFTDKEVFELTAAMVTPNDPAVEALIRSAANYTSSGIMWNGYGGHVNDDNGGVWDRLQAIWQAERNDYNLTYISTWVSFAPGSVQRIRLPSEVLDQHSGNCIELALLYASAAEAMDLEAAVVGIPGHAFVGIRMDQENANYYFIETTMIGQSTFQEAVDRASQEFKDAQPHLDANEQSYGWVTIWDARKNGILPLPWH